VAGEPGGTPTSAWDLRAILPAVRREGIAVATWPPPEPLRQALEDNQHLQPLLAT
jgi:hypothetical protein